MNMNQYIESEGFANRMKQSQRVCEKEMEKAACEAIRDLMSYADQKVHITDAEVLALAKAAVAQCSEIITNALRHIKGNGVEMPVMMAALKIVPIMVKHNLGFYDNEEPHIPKGNTDGN